MDTFLDACEQPKLNKEEIKHLNISIKSNEVETQIESPNKEKPRN
jgi:hypothetical protein